MEVKTHYSVDEFKTFISNENKASFLVPCPTVMELAYMGEDINENLVDDVVAGGVYLSDIDYQFEPKYNETTREIIIYIRVTADVCEWLTNLENG